MKNDEKTLRRIMAYERFYDLLSEKKMTPYKISRLTGIATSTLSDWKNGISMPKQDKMQKIADVLDTTVDFIVDGIVIEYHKADALLDVRITEDAELKKAIKKYYSLDERKQKHVIELINLLSEE